MKEFTVENEIYLCFSDFNLKKGDVLTVDGEDVLLNGELIDDNFNADVKELLIFESRGQLSTLKQKTKKKAKKVEEVISED